MSGQLKEYEVEVNGNTTTMQLDEDDAARLGAGPKATPAGEAAEDDSLVTAEPKTARPANKARAGENK